MVILDYFDETDKEIKVTDLPKVSAPAASCRSFQFSSPYLSGTESLLSLWLVRVLLRACYHQSYHQTEGHQTPQSHFPSKASDPNLLHLCNNRTEEPCIL